MEQLKPRELTQTEQDVLLVISTSEISSAKQISNILEIDEKEVIAILNDDYFYSLICSKSISDMRLAYHSTAIPKLIKHLENDVRFYDSYDRLTKAIGAVKENNNNDMRLSLEVMLKDKRNEVTEKNVTPHTKKKDKEVKVSGNIFEVEDTETNKKVSSHSKGIEFEFFEEEEEE